MSHTARRAAETLLPCGGLADCVRASPIVNQRPALSVRAVAATQSTDFNRSTDCQGS
jgi:hypothetical protein